MENKEIEIRVKPNGDLEIDMINYHGHGCSIDAEELKAKLGIGIESNQKTEYYEHTDNEQHGCN